MLALLVVKRVVRHAARDTFPALALTRLDKTLLTPIRLSRAGGRFPKICVFLFFFCHMCKGAKQNCRKFYGDVTRDVNGKYVGQPDRAAAPARTPPPSPITTI